MKNAKAPTPGVDSARRVLRVLLLFGGQKSWLTVDDIAEQVSISVPSAYRFLSLLRELGLVEVNGEGTYSLTPRIFALASSAELAFSVGPKLRSLLYEITNSTGESALVMRRVGDHASCAEMAETEHQVKLSFAPGQIMGLHRGAGPKLLLASMGELWADRYLHRVGVVRAARAQLLDELNKINIQGWSVSSSEIDEGVWAGAAPIIVGGRTVAALSVAGPNYRINDEHKTAILDQVISQARSASETFTNAGTRVDEK